MSKFSYLTETYVGYIQYYGLIVVKARDCGGGRKKEEIPHLTLDDFRGRAKSLYH